MKGARRPSWQAGPFAEQDTDPLAGLVNIMDVMLVFALGLMLALISQSQELQRHFELSSPNHPVPGAEHRPERSPEIRLRTGEELSEAPASIQAALQGQDHGMESLGQVYRDPQTGKLILVGGQP